ncbi:Predicted metal-dependent hydrolase, TIM-barrel fold [Cupriavidus sp. OV038]|jgi:predicted TIM-barrel fold metal-dependent hydrolase|uniref:amidohydrolase family protein n=1 Tax=unclassified Cupriavidus TaxID=2640874 RepID=UPI0008E45DDE|nr:MULTISPECIES: amidohydrolase family protein [unclassified Cupriavidus]SFC39751.1 Predicted metal-dependent hydrolase, TIM-barrel fold [Cupriavidus sp. OV038]SFP29887.1 Predicted metal-dependent hydrolase, TIM-barrel fold [Cupriavidus sp. OV096]
MPTSAASTSGIWDCHFHIFGPYDAHPLPPNPIYTPPPAPFAEIRAIHAALGIAHGVIVQGACYGNDHSALLAALDTTDGAYRGIATIDPDIDEAQLADMAARGVRGIRLGLMSHLGGAPDMGQMRAVLERIRPYGWHALLHGQIDDVLGALAVLAPLGVPLVIDHMARVQARDGVAYASFARLQETLALPHLWIKLSGPDRITDGIAPYLDAVRVARALLDTAPDRAIWGTDWPHPNIRYPRPDEAQLLAWIRALCGDAATADAVLRHNPARLYA